MSHNYGTKAVAVFTVKNVPKNVFFGSKSKTTEYTEYTMAGKCVKTFSTTNF